MLSSASISFLPRERMYISSNSLRMSATFLKLLGATSIDASPSRNNLMLFKNALSSTRPSSGRTPENVIKPSGLYSDWRVPNFTIFTAMRDTPVPTVVSRISANLPNSRYCAAALNERTFSPAEIAKPLPITGSSGINDLPPGVRL